VDPETGDHIFRFPVPPPPEVPPEELFRWAVEEQLRAILDLVELGVDGQPVRVNAYRFLAEKEFRRLPEER
jgi:hypothetical protein